MPSQYTDATYGDRIAGIYDEWYADRFTDDTTAAVAFLRTLAGPGPVLELGVGTGRVALPLAETGLEVHGIDASEAMVARLREKPGGEAIQVRMDTFADFSLGRSFPLVYVVFNTFFALLSQDEQVSCFQAVARHLTPDGAFLMQAFVPDVSRFDAQNQRTSVDSVGVDQVVLETSIHDPVAQRTDAQHVVISDRSVRLYPVRIRYAYVPELDLMARLAGLRLRERWGGWNREPFPAKTWTHVSVWVRVD
ncbi:MAG: class I SAM-dependent methyltransferase [Jiangellaceae bacterium]|nr:class I SAM-dependent methyltransferase [Jiangellaceae bacterium]